MSASSKVPVDTAKYKKITIKLHQKGIEFVKNTRIMSDTRPFYIRHTNEIIIGKQNYFNGSIAILDKKFDGCICSNAIMSFTVKKEYDIPFIYYCLANHRYLQHREFMSNGTGQKELSEKDFLNFTIRVPLLVEQKKIGQYLSSFLDKMSFEQSYLCKLQLQKSYILKHMFI